MGILGFFLNAFVPIYIHIYLTAPRALSRGGRIKAAARKVAACNLSARSEGGGRVTRKCVIYMRGLIEFECMFIDFSFLSRALVFNF